MKLGTLRIAFVLSFSNVFTTLGLPVGDGHETVASESSDVGKAIVRHGHDRGSTWKGKRSLVVLADGMLANENVEPDLDVLLEKQHFINDTANFLWTRPSLGDSFSLTSSQSELCGQFFFWIALWASLFYISAKIPWTDRIGLSKKPHENDKHWLSRCVVSTIHAGLVSLMALPIMIRLLFASQAVQYGTCSLVGEPSGEALMKWFAEYRIIARAGLAFTTYMVVDCCYSIYYGLATVDNIIHHVAFICAGSVMRSHCMMVFNASILLSMEASTVFLNYALLFRHRGEKYKCNVVASGVVFFVLYLVLRIGVNTYGTIALWKAYVSEYIWPKDYIPAWQQVCVVDGIVVGSLVQFYWLPSILNAFVRGALGGKNEEDEDESGKPAVKGSAGYGSCSKTGPGEATSSTAAYSADVHTPPPMDSEAVRSLLESLHPLLQKISVDIAKPALDTRVGMQMLPDGSFTVVDNLADGGLAAEAGMRIGDIVLSVSGEQVKDYEQGAALVIAAQGSVRIEVLRREPEAPRESAAPLPSEPLGSS